jgi:DNA-binding NtrC family response regulator
MGTEDEESTDDLETAPDHLFTDRNCELVVTEGPDTGKVFPLPPGVVRIGSSPACDIVLADRAISRTHCTIEDRIDGLALKDEGSRNGTRLNGALIKEAILTPGAIVTVGTTQLKFRVQEKTYSVKPTTGSCFGGLIGSSLAMRELFGYLERVSGTSLSVLLLGETGTGKELVARALHDASQRARGPFVVFDCAATEANLVGAALFGHREGAFTGATGQRKGAFLSANGGTLFIDELGELPLDLQPKLLRVLERREVLPIGADAPLRVDVRIVSATHRNLKDLVQKGKFRQDLYYRLTGMILNIPSLREREEDVVMLAEHFLRDARPGVDLGAAARACLLAHSWPGNVRELKNAVERAAALARGPQLGEADLMLEDSPATPHPHQKGSQRLEDVEKVTIQETLSATGWNKTQAARILGITPKTLREKIERYGLTPAGDEAG